MFKKILASALAVTLLMTALTGCGNSKNSGNSTGSESKSTGESGESAAQSDVIDEEPYNVTFMYWVAGEGANQEKVNQAISDLALKELNMTVTLVPVTMGTFSSQIQMMLASNETLDLFPCMSYNFGTYIESQYIVNCADYLEYAPDILEIMGEDAYCAYVGDFLVGFSQMKERGYPAGLVVRKDIFDELGYSVDDFNVTVDDYSSFDQITELFAAVKEKYPDMNCLDGRQIMGLQTGSYIDSLSDTFGVLEDYGQTTTVTNWFESDQYRIFCEYAREWFLAGYTSADIATNMDSNELKMKAGNTFSFITNIKPNTNIEKLAQTGYEVEVIPISEGMKSSSSVNLMVYSIANASKDPAKAMKFLNWAYTSQEFEDLLNWGIEGEDWVEDENGLAAYPDGVDATSVGYHNDYGFGYPNQFAGHPWTGNPTDIWDQYRQYNEEMMASKALGFTFDSSPVTNEIAQLTSVYNQYSRDLSFGTIDVESGLEEYNAALYEAGLQAVMDEKQKQLDAWLAEQ